MTTFKTQANVQKRQADVEFQRQVRVGLDQIYLKFPTIKPCMASDKAIVLALRSDDIDFDSSTIRVDESVDRLGQIGPCKNVSAYRTVVLADVQGQHAIQKLKQFIKQDGLIFRSKRGGPLVENSILVQGLHPALKKLGLPKAGMHAFHRGCNRRWELARVSAAVIRQQMGHASASMTAHYTGEIPVEVVRNFLQLDSNGAAKAA
jgi:integrase